ncbi:MAG: hypothetical protein K0S36_1328 [Nitrosospira multiformis]|nr:hypothetical protein [Nitrosospira multiformis]
MAAPKLSERVTRLLIHVEGETEEAFVKEVLAPHLYGRGYTKVSARLVGNARQRDRRGGIRAWSVVRKDILNHLREDVECLSTTMVDFYALPETGDKAWPGRAKATQVAFAEKAVSVEYALLADICDEMGHNFKQNRFIPYVMMHEFEGLLFSDAVKLGVGIGRPDLSPYFQAIRNQFTTPEEINDSPLTAPAKRILALLPHYEKPLMGTLAVLEIGLDAIRRECPLFRNWIERLEQWPELNSF